MSSQSVLVYHQCSKKKKKRTLKSEHLSLLQKTADFPLRQETPLVIGDGDDIVLFRPWIAWVRGIRPRQVLLILTSGSMFMYVWQDKMARSNKILKSKLGILKNESITHFVLGDKSQIERVTKSSADQYNCHWFVYFMPFTTILPGPGSQTPLHHIVLTDFLQPFGIFWGSQLPRWIGLLDLWIFKELLHFENGMVFSKNRLWLPFRGHHRCGKVHPKKIQKKKHRCELVWRTQGSPQLDSVENYMHHASSCMFQSLNHNLPWFIIPAWVKSSRKSHLENHMMFWAFFRSPRVGNVGGHLIKPVIRMFNGNKKSREDVVLTKPADCQQTAACVLASPPLNKKKRLILPINWTKKQF